MVFVANNDTRELLHAVSDNGINWVRKNNLNQSTKQAPTIASFLNELQVVFVANNDTNLLLKCTYFDALDSWSQNVPMGETTSSAPMLEQIPDSRLFLYFVANNDSHDLLGLSL
jgi:hypothetical protein